MGPGFTDLEKPMSSPSFILEVGGGSSAVDLTAIQTLLAKNYTVCGYDRPGYGKSWQAKDQLSETTMDIMFLAMKAVGFPIQNYRDVICIGHSVGG